MRYVLALILLVLIAAPLPAGDIFSPAVQSGEQGLSILMALTTKKVKTGYKDCLAEALETKRAMVTGIGCDPPEGDWISCRVESLEGFAPGQILVSTVGKVPNGQLWITGRFPAGATAQQVMPAAQNQNHNLGFVTPQFTQQYSQPVMFGGFGGFGGMMGGCGPSGCR